jgi:hypothetical protein
VQLIFFLFLLFFIFKYFTFDGFVALICTYWFGLGPLLALYSMPPPAAAISSSRRQSLWKNSSYVSAQSWVKEAPIAAKFLQQMACELF